MRYTLRKLAAFVASMAVILTAVAPSFQFTARAEGAALSFTPDSGTYAVGKTFTVKVILASGGGVGVNAADGTVSFDKEYLSVTGVSKEGSVFSLWTSEPSFSNSNGTVSFSGGSPAAYTRSGGTVVTITFKGLKAGTANVSFASASVLAADGQGTNVLSDTKKGSFTIGAAAPAPEPEAPPAPEAQAPESTPATTGGQVTLSLDITSPTHPDQEKWYAQKNPEFKWKLPPDVSGISTAFSGNASERPAKVSEGIVENKRYDNVGDGVWYFHAILKTQSGSWTQAVHRKAQVDATPPAEFDAILHQDDRGLSPKLEFRAVDKTSGIDRYEVKVDDRDSNSVTLDQIADGKHYPVPPLLAGKHRLTLRAIDRAGNFAEIVKEFEIEGVAMPQILTSPGTMDERDLLIVEGTADKLAKVIVKVEGGGKTVVEDVIRADEDGKWLYTYKKNLGHGEYTIAVKMITRAGAESAFTDKVPLTVLGAPFIEKYGWALIMLLIMALAALGFLVFYERREFLRSRELARRETDEVKQKTEAVFAALTEEAEEKLELLDDTIAQRLGAQKLSVEDVLDKLRDALDISHDTIAKEIDDVEKALE